MFTSKKAKLEKKAAELGIDISLAKNNDQRKKIINVELARRENASPPLKDISPHGTFIGESDSKEIPNKIPVEISSLVSEKIHGGDEEKIEIFDEQLDEQILSKEDEEALEAAKSGTGDDKGIDPNLGKGDEKTRSDIEGKLLDEAIEKAKIKKHAEALKKVYKTRLNLDEAYQYATITMGLRSNCAVAIYTAKAWLGKLLAQMGTADPYITKQPIKSPKEIPATVDIFDNPKVIYAFNLEDHLQRVIHIRKLLGDCSDSVLEMRDFIIDDQVKIKDPNFANLAIVFSYQNICEARFELGYELSVIRNK